MLTPDQVKPLVLHEDRYVREHAIRYFADSYSTDPELIPLVLESFARYQDDRNLYACSRFTVNDESLPQVLQVLESSGDKAAYFLFPAIENAPSAVLSRNEAMLAEADLPEQTQERLRRRMEFAARPADQLWRELQDYAQWADDSDEVRYANDIDHAYAGDLVKALGERDEPTAEVIAELLGQYDEENGSWLEVFLVDLAGERRIRQAIPQLVDKFRIDTDYLLERANIALAKIGDAEAVRLVREAFLQESWNFRNFAHNVFANIKQPESEEAILSLLELTDDIDDRTWLCMDLCDLFSKRGVDVVRRQIKAGYERFLVNLEELLLVVAQVHEIDLPEAEQWRAEREERERRQAERWRELEAIAASGLQEFEAMKPRKSQSPMSNAVFDEETTIRHEAPRVGRNDPCPCGSGKKYKKCCGRK